MFEEQAGRRTGPSRKDQQLCAQVRRALGCVFPALPDEVLRDLTVVDVTPAPDGSRLAVALVGPPGATLVVAEVLERLRQAHGRLRAEVTAAITRKRAPELAFVVVASEDGPGEPEDEPGAGPAEPEVTP